VQAKRHNPPSDTHRRFRGFEGRCVRRRILFNEFSRSCRPIEFVRVGVMAACFYLGKLLLALKILVLWLKR
jgi:hypothetical protein